MPTSLFLFLIKTSIVTTSEMERRKKDRNGGKEGKEGKGEDSTLWGDTAQNLNESTSVTLALVFNSQPALSGSQK